MPRINRSAEEQRQLDDHGPEFLGVLARSLRVIVAIGASERATTLNGLAAALDLPRATVRRVLYTLSKLGFVEADGRLFRLTPKILTLATGYLSSNPIPLVMQPIVERVSALVRKACSAAVLDGDEVVFVARATPARILTVGLEIGYRLPASSTAVGRVLLAGLSDPELDASLSRAQPSALTDRTVTDPNVLKALILEARAQDYAIVDQEVERGFRSIAVLVRRRNGRPSCALHIGLHVDGTSLDDTKETFLPVLRAAAQEAEPMLV